MKRTIFHVDMDAFYASVEQRMSPEYRRKPVIVGADPQQGRGRGVVAACSYEARKFGIRSALPISKAFRLCPTAIYLRPNFQKYSEISHEIRAVMRSFTERIEPLSIDEAFLDMSQKVKNDEEAMRIGRSVKRRIFSAQGLTASVGIGPSKFIAKIASDLEKPDGLVLVRADEVQSFLDPLPISRLWGVGPKTAAKLSRLGIHNIEQLRQFNTPVLLRHFGKLGNHLWRLANGIDECPVVETHKAKSVGHEKTFSEDVLDEDILSQTLHRLTQGVSKRLQRGGLAAKTVTLKLRYSDFTTITRQTTMKKSIWEARDILEIAQRLLGRFREPDRRVRLIGVSVSSLSADLDSLVPRQMELFK